MFLGINMAAKSIILAILAGVSQFLQMHLSPSMQSSSTPIAADADMQTKMAGSMTKSMKYTMPIMIAVFGYAVPGAVALYWIVSNICMIAQERFVMYRMKIK
jgi:YidC/Oxa1 family membrane protein insertase